MMKKTANIFQVIEVNASPSDIYNLLIDEVNHAAFTNKACLIDAQEGGSFSFCNGNHTGNFLKLVKNKRMVLAWTHRKFPRGHYSIVDLSFEKSESGGTRLSMNHMAVPETCDGWLTEAWHKTYWLPLAEYVNEEMLA